MLRAIAVLLSGACLAWPAEMNLADKVKAISESVLAASGVPSASIAIVQDGRVSLVKAYGKAGLQPERAAEPGMRYAVGSISKQFTAAAVLLLVEEGKLKLDDPVSKWYPGLTSASQITIRMLLSHTSGYSDYWPQDYVMKPMMQPTSAAAILDTWANRPLDFAPGTKWQYSNTNYVLAGQIVEKVAGKPLMSLLQDRIFQPLGMKTVFDVDQAPLPPTDATGYYRHALGPLRPAPKEGRGWLSAAGELSMTAEDLARWDISLVEKRLLRPESYAEMFREVKTKDGKGTGYGLGLFVGVRNGHPYLTHSGEVSGFVSDTIVLPEDKAAVVALTNQDAIGAAAQIASAVTPLLVGRDKAEAQALSILEGLQAGRLDRSLFTDNANAYFSDEAVQDFAQSLGPLGEPLSLTKQGENLRGGMTFRSYRIRFASRELQLTTYETANGKLEQYLISPREGSN